MNLWRAFLACAWKWFRMVRYYGFLSSTKRSVLEVVSLLTKTLRKTATEVGPAGLHSVRKKDVFQRAETGVEACGNAGLSWAPGANEICG